MGTRVRDLVTSLGLDWRVTRQYVLRMIKTSLVFVVVLLGVLLLLHNISPFFHKTDWQLLKVLAVPITIGAAVPLLNWLQKKRELDVEHQRAQDEALQGYLDQISKLLTEGEHPLR